MFPLAHTNNQLTNPIDGLRDRNALEIVHKAFGESETTIGGCHSEDRDVAVPVVSFALAFAHNVAHGPAVPRFSQNIVVGPTKEIVEIEFPIVLFG